MKRAHHILLLGSYGRGNVGDDAFLLAACRLFPSQKLYVNSANDELLPSEIKSRITTISTLGLRDVIFKARVFTRIQAIAYWGGDLWVELHGDRFPRQSLYKMALLNVVARLMGKKVYYIGCGVGNLTGYSRWLARFSARLADGIVVREQRSANVLQLASVQVAPDLTVNLPYYRSKKLNDNKKRRFIIGVALLHHIPNASRDFPLLIDRLAAFLFDLSRERFRIVLLPMLVAAGTGYDDLWASKQLRERLPEHDIEVVIPPDIASYIEVLAGFDLLLGVRLHANILATLAGTPCLGIAYRPKVSSFFSDNGLSDYCLDLKELDQLSAKFHHMRQTLPLVQKQFALASKRLLSKRTIYQTFIDQRF